MNFKGKTILVTGAASGIGHACAAAFAEAGGTVILTDINETAGEAAAKALLAQNPDPTDEEVRYWLAGNLCRCTGYDKIVRAVLDTAAEMRGA